MMENQDWQHYTSADGSFELWLPVEAELQEDLSTPPGETYLYWTPERGKGTFSIFRQKDKVTPDIDPVVLEKSLGSVVTVEIDEQAERDGAPARHLRFRSKQVRPSELEMETQTGERRHTGGDQIEQVAEYWLWTGEDATIRAGYRLDVTAIPRWHEIFQEMLERFRILRFD